MEKSMKKQVLLGMGLWLAVLGSWAGDYKYLVFKCPDVPQSIETDGLEMTVSNGKLIVTNDYATYDFDLSTLSYMFFSEMGVTGVNEVTSTEPRPVQVRDLSGRLVGSFASQKAARQSLPKGVYVVQQDGNNIKMAVK